MDELISRNEAIDVVAKWLFDVFGIKASDSSAPSIYKSLKELPSAQPYSKESSVTQKALDTISRQAAIDALSEVAREKFNLSDGFEYYLNGLIDGEVAIRALPSAQPETHEKRTETHGVCLDAIDRRAAIDALDCISGVEEVLRSLPSAQPVAKDINVPVKDCISRQAVFDALDNIKIPRNASWYPYYQQALTAVSKLPSAQPEIIHCRDCKHWREGDAYSYCQKLFNCGVLDVYDYMRAEDDFCSEAERGTDG